MWQFKTKGVICQLFKKKPSIWAKTKFYIRPGLMGHFVVADDQALLVYNCKFHEEDTQVDLPWVKCVNIAFVSPLDTI